MHSARLEEVALPRVQSARCEFVAFDLACTDEQLQAAILHLSSSEQERAARYRVDRAQRQFILGRSKLRQLLAARHRCSPHEIEFDYSPTGKPQLRSGEHLWFNLTHSGSLGLIALAPTRVGIDLEQIRPMTNEAGLIERFFSTYEREVYQTLPEELRNQAFFRAWTAKEALLKAVGSSIQHLDDCIVEMDCREAIRIVSFEQGAACSWELQSWEPTPGYVASVAVEQ